MKVILIKDVSHLGQIGDLKEVKDGFGRNYLIPQGLAVFATSEEMKKWQAQKEKIEKEKSEKLKSVQDLFSKLKNLTLTIRAKAGSKGKLFGAITNQDISEKLAEKGYEISKKDIEIPLIKELGGYKAEVHLGEGIKVDIKIKIVEDKLKAKK